jgi:hypothetical protein
MGKFNNTNNHFSALISQTEVLKSISVEISNLIVMPIWEQLGISETEYIARENALYVYDASNIEIEIINRVDNDVDLLTDESLISIIAHEDEETLDELENSETIADTNNNITVSTIVQQLEAIIVSRLNAM